MLNLKLNAAVLGVVALLVVASGITASTASAAGPYWYAGGNKLAKGRCF